MNSGEAWLAQIPPDRRLFLRGTGALGIASRRCRILPVSPFRSPEDLASIYGRLDVVWAGDFMEARYNSAWLLPNRIYEGGYYCTPSIAPAGTETAAWLARNACGFIIGEQVETSLPELIAGLIEDRLKVASYAAVLAAMPEDTFIQPEGFLAAIVNAALTTSSQPVRQAF